MEAKETLYLVMPAYNEEENIEQVVRSWYPILDFGSEESRLLIINDGSKDKTGEVLERLASELPKLAVKNEQNSGHGASVLKAYRYALEAGADYIFQTDSDDQTKASDFEALWIERHHYDVLMGFRKNRTDGQGRATVSLGLTFMLCLFFRTWVRDANVPFRLYPRRVLEALVPVFEDPNFSLPNGCLTAEANKLGLTFYRRDIAFPPRKKGVNSINAKRIVKIALAAFKSFHRQGKAFRRAIPALKEKLEVAKKKA